MQEVFEEIIEELGTEVFKSSGNMIRTYAFEKAVEIVRQAATEHNNGWIPCSERSPEDGEEVLVTDGKHVYLVKYDADLDASFGDMDGIVAWQPLPKPYQPKGE